MTKRQDIARHRAPQNTGSLEVLTKAVASNAGTVGRQAAVIAAAGGLVVTLGVSGSTVPQAAPAAKADNNTAALDIQRVSATQVVAAKVSASTLKASMPLVKVKAAPAPAVQAAPAAKATLSVAASPEAEVENTSNASSSNASSASATRSSSSSSSAASNSSSSSSSNATSAAKAETSAPSSNPAGSSIAATAQSYLGAPYVLGGNTPSGWDCSGFVRYVYAQHGMNISQRTARGIWGGGQFVKTSNPKPGDIIIQRGGAHIAIYLGGSKYIGAQNPSSGTAYRDLNTTYDSFNGFYTWVG